MKDYEVIGATWRCNTIGIVAVNYPNNLPRPYWQAYIGVIKGFNQEKDITDVIEWGDKLSWQEAQAFFPDLHIKRYKTYPMLDLGAYSKK
jgi:hypothetical protein